ncbi:hypothetical protein VTK26DRAFT_2686 [Humicola hyalothermophila]
MSTIASPRDPQGPFRRTNSSQAIITPTSSSRPSLDVPNSTSSSPNPNSSSTATSQAKRANRAALREYYNLRSQSNKPLPSTPSSPPTVEVTSPLLPPSSSLSLSSSTTTTSNPATAALDAPSLDPHAYASSLLASSSLAELLRVYAAILSEMRALDAEKKALVYDNYSKLIAATETIRRMRGAVGKGNSGGVTTGGLNDREVGPGPGTGTGTGTGMGGYDEGEVQRIVEDVWKLAESLRPNRKEGGEKPGAGEGNGEGGGEGGGGGGVEDQERRRKKERTRELAREVVRVVGRLGRLVNEGREEEARKEWEVPRRLLVRWKELGIGGADVEELIEEGDRALRKEGIGVGKEEGERGVASAAG